MFDIHERIQVLSKEGNLVFPPNIQEVERLKEPLTQLKSKEINGATYWFDRQEPLADNIRVKIYPTGHTVFYNSLGKRFLMTDPSGNILHEAEWERDQSSNEIKLKHVRMQLDCQQWIGIRPKAKTFSTHISIKSQPNWERMTLDDLRHGASQAWQVPFSEVKYFYHDKNFITTGEGEYDVQLQKDGLYVLINGNFEKTQFVSFMFTVNWEHLDLIPVVELFQSTLPGSGGAVFEFIWGLYEDQSRDNTMLPLRYRGLPTYPSSEAYNIFSAFFEPRGPKGEKILDVFMNADRSHEIEWTPKSHPPWRYFDTQHKISLTVQEGYLFKVTSWNDPAAIPFINTAQGGRGSCQRYMEVLENRIVLHDAQQKREISLKPDWNIEPSGPVPVPAPQSFGWKKFFEGNVPEVDPIKILYTVPFYPEGADPIDESSLQPMALDQIFYYMENHKGMPEKLESVKRVLIHTFDTVISGCIDCTHEREYVVLYGDPEFAVKNAQQLWNYSVTRKQLDGVSRVRFLPEMEYVEEAYEQKYDMIFKWIPFMYHHERETAEQILMSVTNALEPGGILFLQGPHPIRGLFDHYNLISHKGDAIINMPFFRQHLKMCPENTINPEATIFFAEKKS